MPFPAVPVPSVPVAGDRDGLGATTARYPTDVTREVAASLRRATADAVTAYLDTKVAPVTEDEAGAWIDSGTGLSVSIAAWVAVGIRTPQQRPDGVSLKDVRRLAHLRVVNPSAQWAGVSGTCLLAHRTLAAAGKGVGETIALALALGEVADRVHPWSSAVFRSRCLVRECFCQRHVSHYTDAETVAAEASDLDWADLTVCLRAGLTVEEAMTHVREGRDMGPVRVLAALG